VVIAAASTETAIAIIAAAVTSHPPLAKAPGCPVTGFHSRMVPSLYAPASSLPSGLNATLTAPFRPAVPARVNEPAVFPVAGSHNRMVPSL
jgi:hypothetical protein